MRLKPSPTTSGAVDKPGALVSIRLDMAPGTAPLGTPPPAMHPLSWRDWERPAHSKASAPRRVRGAILQRWEGSAPEMDQPPLDHHYIVVHLGGDKRVTRRRRTEAITRDVPHRAISTIAAGSSYRWQTEGPIAFGHIYLDPDFFAQTIAEHYDRDPARIELHEDFGQVDPLLGPLCHALVRAGGDDDLSLMAQEAQLESALHRLYERQTALTATGGKMLIAPASVRRVRDYIGAHLSQQITLDELADLSGYSRFHFARGFKAATGLPPYAFILRARIALACQLLDEARLPVQAVARLTGFASHPQFTSRFRQLTGISPVTYRRIMR